MGTLLSGNQITVSFPYYGLFSQAQVRLLRAEGDPLFECQMLNGAVLWLKRLSTSRRWIDAQSNSETSLSSVLGMYIEDQIREA